MIVSAKTISKKRRKKIQNKVEKMMDVICDSMDKNKVIQNQYNCAQNYYIALGVVQDLIHDMLMNNFGESPEQIKDRIYKNYGIRAGNISDYVVTPPPRIL